MLLTRSLDVGSLNEVANDPGVRPFIGGEGEIDLTAIVANPRNYVLVLDGGGFVIQALEQGVYEVHSLFLPSARRHSIAAMREGMEYMFFRTDCFRIVTRVPSGNKPAHALAGVGGFSLWFKREADEYFAIDLDQWVATSKPARNSGAEFHDFLTVAKRNAGSELPEHSDDTAHDCFVGAALSMCRAGNPIKGVAVYNRWARFAGYAPISIVSIAPLVVDVLDAVLELDGENMKVLTCR